MNQRYEDQGRNERDKDRERNAQQDRERGYRAQDDDAKSSTTYGQGSHGQPGSSVGQSNYGQSNYGQGNYGQSNPVSGSYGQGHYGPSNYGPGGQSHFGQNQYGYGGPSRELQAQSPQHAQGAPYGQSTYGQSHYGRDYYGPSGYSQTSYGQPQYGAAQGGYGPSQSAYGRDYLQHSQGNYGQGPYGQSQYGQGQYGQSQYGTQHDSRYGRQDYGYGRQSAWNPGNYAQQGSNQSYYAQQRDYGIRDYYGGRDFGHRDYGQSDWGARDYRGDYRGDVGQRDYYSRSSEQFRTPGSYAVGSSAEPSFGTAPRYFGTGTYASGGTGFTGGYGDDRSRWSDYNNPTETDFYGGGHSRDQDRDWRWGRSRGEQRQGFFARLFNRGPKGYQRSDERIREDISERLMQTDYIDSSEVSISVSEGKVTLDGTVPERYMKHSIEDLVDACPGVKDIDNRVRVHSARGAWAEDRYASSVSPSATSSTGNNGTTTRAGDATSGLSGSSAASSTGASAKSTRKDS